MRPLQLIVIIGLLFSLEAQSGCLRQKLFGLLSSHKHFHYNPQGPLKELQIEESFILISGINLTVPRNCIKQK